MEPFTGSCTNICSITTPIPDTLRAACDTGSQQYCTTDTNILTGNCKTYLNRVTGNMTANRQNKVYANPIKFLTKPGQTLPSVQDYYNALGTSITSLPKDGPTLVGSDVKDIVTTLKTNPDYASDPTYQTLTKAAFDYCTMATNIDTNFCAESGPNLSWAALEFTNTMNAQTDALKAKNISGSLVAYYSSTATPTKVASDLAAAKLAHARMPNTMKPLDDMILNSLTKDDLLDPNLVVLRAVSPYLQTGVDTFVINLINGSKSSFSRERLTDSTTMYSTTLSSNGPLYSQAVRTFLSNLQSFNTNNKITNDPLVALIQTTDNANMAVCSTGNPLSNPICAQVANATGSVNASTILDTTVAYCSDAKNVSDLKCISHINTNQKAYNINDVNTKMLNYCLSTDGRNDNSCKPFSTITGSDQWLINATKNTTDSNGVVSTVCGTSGNLSKDTCQNVCLTYPEVCLNDSVQKCAKSDNRYSTNVDYFEGSSKEESTSASTIIYYILYLLAAILIALVIAGGVMAIGNSDRYQCFRYKNNCPEDKLGEYFD